MVDKDDRHILNERFGQMLLIFAGTELWFIFIYILVHKTTIYTPFQILSFLSNFVFYYLYKKTGNYEKYGRWIFWVGALYATVLVYSAGAKNAPGPFAFAIIPMASAFFFGTKDLNLSFIVSVILFLTVMIGGEFYPPPKIEVNYIREKLQNTLVFIFIFYYCVRSFIQTIEKKDIKINRQKDNIQNLLRILIHDVATPLSLANGRIKKLESDGTKLEEIRKPLETINSIISDVRRLEQIGNGKMELNKKNFHVSKMLDEIHKEMHTDLQNKKISLEINCSSELEYKGDYSIIKNNLLINLLTNALKFSRENDKIKIDVKKELDLIITITDYGEGIPKDILHNIFDATKPTTRRGTNGEKGSGFGMPIVKKLIELMEGEISIETNYPSMVEEVGTIVTIKLPYEVYLAEI